MIRKGGRGDKHQVIIFIRYHKKEIAIKIESIKPRVDSVLTFLKITPSKPEARVIILVSP